MEDNLSGVWVIIGGICSFLAIVVAIILFICHNHKQKSHKFKLSIIKSCLNGPELEVKFMLENRPINNIQFERLRLELLNTRENICIHTKSILGNYLLLSLGLLFVGGQEAYSIAFQTVDSSKINKGIDKFKLYIYTKHSDKPVSKVGKICRESKQD